MADPTTSPRPCKRCGTHFPFTREFFCWSNKYGVRQPCRECQREIVRNHARNHKAEAAARGKIWYEVNKARRLEKCQEWYKDNRDKFREYRRQYHEKTRDRAHELNRIWTETHNAEVRVIGQRRRARERGVVYTFTKQDWRRAVDYFEGRCAVCNRLPDFWSKLAMDHWIPLSTGGPTTPDNIVPLCHGLDGCNNSKANNLPEDWLIHKFGKRKAAQILKRIAGYFEWLKVKRD